VVHVSAFGGGAEVGTKGGDGGYGVHTHRQSCVVTVLVLLDSLLGNFILFIAIE
jgi:hypothetical protein